MITALTRLPRLSRPLLSPSLSSLHFRTFADAAGTDFGTDDVQDSSDGVGGAGESGGEGAVKQEGNGCSKELTEALKPLQVVERLGESSGGLF